MKASTGLQGNLFTYQASFLRVLSWRRLTNLLVLRFSYLFTRISGGYFHAGQPTSLFVEPTNRCQLRCPGCPSGLHSLNRSLGRMDLGLYRSVITQAHKHIFHLALYFQGEPLLHPNLSEMIRIAAAKRIYTQVSTNGNLLDTTMAQSLLSSGLNHLIISLDGMTEEVYQAYRIGGSLQLVLAGVEQLVQLNREQPRRKRMFIELQFVVTAKNEHQCPDFLAYARKSGVDLYRIKSAMLSEDQLNEEWIPQNRKLSRYAPDHQGGWILKNPLKNHCWKVWSSSVINWDGHIVPCCFDKTASFSYGSLKEHSFSTIWRNQTATSFRKQVFTNRKQVNICCQCTEGMSV